MAELAPGALIAGKYRVDSVVAESQTTTTYACSAGAARQFVKVLKSIVADDREDRGRFEREFKVLQSLGHPCVASVVGMEKTGKGIPCIVMEHLDGETLKAILKRGPLDPGAAAGLLMHLLSALQLAHGRGVFHRDLEPANLFVVQREGGAWHLKIFNFGAARTADAAAGAAALTQAGTTLGAAEYMSPEQARGKTVDGRSDLYAVGCLAYAMLTGGPPFPGAGPSVLLRHLTEAPAAIRTKRRDVTPDLEAWVLRTLAKEPKDRFRDAQEARETLHAAMGGSIGARQTMRSAPASGGAVAAPAPRSTSGAVAAVAPRSTSGAVAAAAPAVPSGAARTTIPPEGSGIRPRFEGTPAPVSAVVSPGPRMVISDRDLQWGAGPAGLPADCRMAVIEGDPTQPGPYTFRLRFPTPARIEAHSHPRVERVTVLSGSVTIGDGSRLRTTGARRLPAGSYYATPPGFAHYMWTEEPTVLQVSGAGPWGIHFVDEPGAGGGSGPKKWIG